MCKTVVVYGRKQFYNNEIKCKKNKNKKQCIREISCLFEICTIFFSLFTRALPIILKSSREKYTGIQK